jgi:hypothetical protein
MKKQAILALITFAVIITLAVVGLNKALGQSYTQYNPNSIEYTTTEEHKTKLSAEDKFLWEMDWERSYVVNRGKKILIHDYFIDVVQFSSKGTQKRKELERMDIRYLVLWLDYYATGREIGKIRYEDALDIALEALTWDMRVVVYLKPVVKLK